MLRHCPCLIVALAFAITDHAVRAQGLQSQDTRFGASARQALGDRGPWRMWRGDTPRTAALEYEALYELGGMVFTPALGLRAPRTYPTRIDLQSIRRGGVVLVDAAGRAVEPTTVDDLVVVYSRGVGITERYVARRDGVELSYEFAKRPPGAGDLVVRCRVDTELSLDENRATDGGVRLNAIVDGVVIGGVAIGGVTGIDATGRRVPGSLRFDGEYLSMCLPASFVDGAVYPLVLDPLVGTHYGVSLNRRFDHLRPDVTVRTTYTAADPVFAWQWSIAASDSRILVESPPYGAITVATGICTSPAAAWCKQTNKLVVAWERLDRSSNKYQVEACRVDLPLVVIDSMVVETNARYPDLGGDATVGDDEAVVVYEVLSGSNAGVWAADLRTNSTIRTWTKLQIAAGGARPAISKTVHHWNGVDGYCVVWEQVNSLGDTWVWARMLNRNVRIWGSAKPVFVQRGSDSVNADVDGDGITFVAVAEERRSGNPTRIVCRSLTWDPQAGVLTPSPLGRRRYGSSESLDPTVAHFGNKFIQVNREQSLSTFNLIVRELSPEDCTFCGWNAYVSEAGHTIDSVAIVADRNVGWDHSTGTIVFGLRDVSSGRVEVYGQQFDEFGNGGSRNRLSPACGIGSIGTGGIHIGNTGFSVSASTSASLAVVNLTVPGTPSITCGPCEITAPVISIPAQTTGSTARAAIPLRCSLWPAMNGAAIEFQIVAVDPSVQACALLSGIGASDRLQITLGL